MKKTLIALFALLAALSCSKTDITFEEEKEIMILPVNNKVTKSVMSGTDFLGDGFMVWAWYQETPVAEGTISKWQTGFADDAAVGTTTYINEKLFIEKNSNLNLWGGQTPYYWPKTGSLIFAGYHAPNLTKAEDVNYTFDETNNYMSFNDIQQTKLTPGATFNEDIMYFNMTTNSYNHASGTVNLDFNHALTWVTVTLQKKTHPEIEATIRIHDVYFTEVCATGDGTVENQETIEWDVDPTSATNWEVLDDGSVVLLYKKTEASGTEPEKVESVITTLDEYLIIPQKINGKLKVRYSVESTDGSTFTETYTVNLSALKEGSHSEWLPGKHYTYNISIGTDELLVTPVINDWAPIDTSILIPLPEITPGQPGTEGGSGSGN